MGMPADRVKPVVHCGPSRVKQEFANLSDINSIVSRYRRTGAFDHVARTAPVFADVSQMGDFASVMRRVAAAREAFDSLPAIVRSRFHNDPRELIAFIQDPMNGAEAVKLGLAVARKPVVPPAPVLPAK